MRNSSSVRPVCHKKSGKSGAGSTPAERVLRGEYFSKKINISSWTPKITLHRTPGTPLRFFWPPYLAGKSPALSIPDSLNDVQTSDTLHWSSNWLISPQSNLSRTILTLWIFQVVTCISSGLRVSPRFDMTQASSDRLMNPLPSWQQNKLKASSYSQSAPRPLAKYFHWNGIWFGEVYSLHQRPGRLPLFHPLHSQPRPKCWSKLLCSFFISKTSWLWQEKVLFPKLNYGWVNLTFFSLHFRMS